MHFCTFAYLDVSSLSGVVVYENSYINSGESERTEEEDFFVSQVEIREAARTSEVQTSEDEEIKAIKEEDENVDIGKKFLSPFWG